MTVSIPLAQAPITVETQDRATSDFYRFLSSVATGLNAVTNYSNAAPTGNSWKVGNFFWNSNPSEAGSVGSKYVVLGWVCTVSGTPGTWLPCRVLTGN